MGGEAARKAWLVAVSIGAIEALKDQGVARWNGPLRELHHHAKTKLLSSYSKATTGRSGRSLFMTAGKYRAKRTTEESMKKVMDMSCFGPNTVRF